MLIYSTHSSNHTPLHKCLIHTNTVPTCVNPVVCVQLMFQTKSLGTACAFIGLFSTVALSMGPQHSILHPKPSSTKPVSHAGLTWTGERERIEVGMLTWLNSLWTPLLTNTMLKVNSYNVDIVATHLNFAGSLGQSQRTLKNHKVNVSRYTWLLNILYQIKCVHLSFFTPQCCMYAAQWQNGLSSYVHSSVFTVSGHPMGH